MSETIPYGLSFATASGVTDGWEEYQRTLSDAMNQTISAAMLDLDEVLTYDAGLMPWSVASAFVIARTAHALQRQRIERSWPQRWRRVRARLTQRRRDLGHWIGGGCDREDDWY